MVIASEFMKKNDASFSIMQHAVHERFLVLSIEPARTSLPDPG